MSAQVTRKLGSAALLVGGLLLLIWLGMVVYAAGDLAEQAQATKGLASGGIGNVDTDTVTTVLLRTRRDVVMLRRQAGWLVAPASHLRWLPKVGPLLGEGPALLELGDALTDLGMKLWADVEPSVVRYQNGESWQGLLPEALPAVGRDLERKQALARRAQSAYAELDIAALPSGVRGYAELLGQGLPLLADGLEVAGVAPALLGFDAPRTYLVLALNEDELRPGGGFITGVGEVQVVAGDIVSMVFRDSYAVDDFSLPYPDPPEPLRQFMGLDLWVFRDSNWSPDFPTAARQALEFYRPGVAVDVTGVIAIDQRGVQLLLEGLGPLDAGGVPGSVTADNVLDYMHEAWAPEDGALDAEWWRQRKSFMGNLATAAMARLRAGEVDLSALSRQVIAALDQRHIQVYAEEPAVQRVLAERQWDGGLTTSPGDYLALVEANLGYNKASRSVVRTVSYEVDLRDALPRAEVVIHFIHMSDREKPCTPEIRYDPVYEDMMHRCYWAHLRLFVPRDAALTSATFNSIAADYMFSRVAWPGEVLASDDLGHTVFDQSLLLPTGGEMELRFTYLLPADIVRQEPDGSLTYRLLLRKQAGIEELAGTVTLRLPGNAVVLEGFPNQLLTVDGTFFAEFASTLDTAITVRYLSP